MNAMIRLGCLVLLSALLLGNLNFNYIWSEC